MSHIQPTSVPAAIASNHGAICVSLELSRRNWLATALLPGSEKMSKYPLEGGDGRALLRLLEQLRERAQKQHPGSLRIVTIYEAGLDGFWLDRLLKAHGVESHVVDPGSIALPRRAKRAKSDRIDGETLLRTLLAWLRGEPRVCSMVRPPSPEEEDRRRLTRERQALLQERTRLSNRIRGLLAAQGAGPLNPLNRNCRQKLQALRTGDGCVLPEYLTREIHRALDRIDLLRQQLKQLDAERAALVAQHQTPALLIRLKSIGPEFAASLWLEALYRSFSNRRQLGAYAGLTSMPWKSGKLDHEQGISKAGNPRLRRVAIELAWLWLRHQPQSALSRWYVERVGTARGRLRRIMIVALARKLLVALWRYVNEGIVPEGAAMKTA